MTAPQRSPVEHGFAFRFVVPLALADWRRRWHPCIGLFAASRLPHRSPLAFIYGQRATDHGLHQLSIVMGAVSAFLLIAAVFDQTIPRIAPVATEPVASTH